MIGAIIGDIVGSVYEFRNIKNKDFEPFFHPKGRFTDDSVMTIAVYKALQDCKNEFENASEEEKQKCKRNPLEEYKNLTKNAVNRLREYGNKYLNAGYGQRFILWLTSKEPKPYNSLGNGAAMRVSPVAYFANSVEDAKVLSKMVTEITHNHPDGLKGAESTAVATWMALNGYDKKEIAKVFENYYSLDFNYEDLVANYRYDISCKGTVPVAMFCFIKSKNFEDAIRLAISVGGDSDTIGAITGAVAGAYYGVPKQFETSALEYLDDNLKNDYQEFKNNFTAKNKIVYQPKTNGLKHKN